MFHWRKGFESETEGGELPIGSDVKDLFYGLLKSGFGDFRKTKKFGWIGEPRVYGVCVSYNPLGRQVGNDIGGVDYVSIRFCSSGLEESQWLNKNRGIETKYLLWASMVRPFSRAMSPVLGSLMYVL